MKRISRIAASFAGLLAVLPALPAPAQYATEFSLAKLTKEGTTSKPIAGSGTVKVQVLVHSDGSHKVIKVISSTNPGDNAAALEIAQNSTYRPAHKGTKPVESFYDFTFKFNGKSLQSSSSASTAGAAASSGNPAAAKIADLLAAGKYADAKAQAQMALLSSPTDEMRSLLATADAQMGNFADAAATFDHVAEITHQFHLIASQSYANAAVALSQTDPTQALAYAQKAVTLDPSTNSLYALGVAQLGDKQYPIAIATLKAVRLKMFADPKTPANVKVAIDTSLLSAYVQSGDTAGAQTLSAEIKSIDPTSTLPARVLGNTLLQSGVTALQAQDYATALKDFDQAAAQGDPAVTVTADTQAALVIARMEKPDYARMQAYAEKALAIKPDDATANYAEGIALTATSSDAASKKKALDALNKADELAKAAGNEALALQIETFIKQNASNLGAPAGGSNR